MSLKTSCKLCQAMNTPCKSHQLNDPLNENCPEPIAKSEIGQYFIEVTIKDEPLQCKEESVTSKPIFANNFEYKKSIEKELIETKPVDFTTGVGINNLVTTVGDHIKQEGTPKGMRDDQMTDTTELIDVKHIKVEVMVEECDTEDDELQRVENFKRNREDAMHIVLEPCEDVATNDFEDNAPAKKHKRADLKTDYRTPRKNKISEKQRNPRTVKNKKVSDTNVNVMLNNETRLKNWLISSNTADNDCINTDIDVSSIEYLMKIFVCDLCGVTFDDKYILTLHIKHEECIAKSGEGSKNKHAETDGKNLYKCDVCQQKFAQKINFDYHLKTHAREKPYKCAMCERSFTKKANLVNHLKAHTKERPYKCSVCERSFAVERNLIKHLRKHIEEKPSKGTIDQQRISDSGLTGPVAKDNVDKPFQCEICHLRFTQKSNLSRHTKQKHTDKCLQCPICRWSFTVKAKLNYHLKTHIGEKPFKCKKCKESFKHKEELDKHSFIHIEKKHFECTICQKTFTVKGSLKAHIETHSGEKPYNCSICQRAFTRKNNLKNHFRKHSGEKPFKCTFCPQSFTENCSLKIHTRKHTGEKPFECSMCPRTFAIKSDLKNHLRTHTGEKPFGCTICHRRFTQRGTLNIHLRVHTGERPFECAICQRTFIEKGTLKKHLRAHTGLKLYQCTLCQRRFAKRDTLKAHLLSKHSEISAEACKEYISYDKSEIEKLNNVWRVSVENAG